MKKITKPRGTQDILPQESWKWQALEDGIRTVAHSFGYGEMRLPTFEATEVFSRSVGDSTDIVNKEMYTFEDKGGRSITLRPEGTAGVVRATLENGLLNSMPLPLKSYYIQSCFRYEKAQKGRLREFHQFGIECMATHDAASDVEAMEVAHNIMLELGVRDAITLEINSIGCPKCRPLYQQKLVEYFEAYRSQLCPLCIDRLEKNPMRLLDCKEDACAKIAKDAPVMLDYLCEDCATHFGEVKQHLNEAEINYVVNPHIVRGLDYYTNTVFEFIADGVGTQGTVCAGGRYDGLIEQMGGQATPAVGFAMGLERMLLLLEENGLLQDNTEGPLVFVAGMGQQGAKTARAVTRAFRREGFVAECDIAGRSLKAQMKAANRLNAQYTLVIGDDEAASGSAKLKKMADGSEYEFSLQDAVLSLVTVWAGDEDVDLLGDDDAEMGEE